MCWGDTQVKPIDAEDHAIGLVKYENGAIGQFEVSWTFRGGLDLRDEVMGTEGTIWINSFLRTGFEMFTTGKGSDYVAEKAESDSGWIFPVGDELNELGYNHMFTNMFEALSFTCRFSSLAQAERYDRKCEDWHVTRIILSRLLLDIDGFTLRWWCNEFILDRRFGCLRNY